MARFLPPYGLGPSPNPMPPTLQDALQQHQGGDLPRAAVLYGEILAADPRDADAYHLLGVLMHQMRQSQVAVELMGEAIQINADVAPYHNNLGNALLAVGRRGEARESFRRSLALHRHADTFVNLATLDLGDGRMAEAKAGFEAALRLAPQRLESLVGLGRIALLDGHPVTARRRLEEALSVDPACVAALIALGELHVSKVRYAEAEVCFLKAIECQPATLDAHFQLGNVHMRMQRYASAAASYRRALEMSPRDRGLAVLLALAYLADMNGTGAKDVLLRAVEIDGSHAETHHLLGHALVQCRDSEGAVLAFERSLRLGSDRAKALNGMGTAYDAMGDYVRAAVALEEAVALAPDVADFLLNLGLARARQGDVGAIAILERAVALEPTDAATHVGLAEALLSSGEYARGFAEYEWRWRSPAFAAQHRAYVAPLWDGSPLGGRRILLHAEQGLGDTIQFLRYVPLVARLGGVIVLVVQAPVMRLVVSADWICTCMVQGGGPLPEFDVQCPLLSLPGVLGTRLETVPEPFDLREVAGLGGVREAGGFVTVGLVWAGNPQHLRDGLRSLPLAALLPLRDVGGCRFVRLQQHVAAADRGALETFAMETVLDGFADLLDTARAMRRLDLLICVDTCVAHLAATMGKDVWLILPEAADWRWGTTAAATPWYPTMRLFRRRAGEATDPLAERLTCALEEYVHASTGAGASALRQPSPSRTEGGLSRATQGG